jgi:GT2 family glycosyltransferase
MQKELSIIMVNTNSVDYLRQCIPTIYSGHLSSSFEIVVVDNDSHDGAEDFLRENFPDVIYVRSDTNLGFTRANNLGYAHSDGRYLLFLNADTEIHGAAVQMMLDGLRENENAGVIGPRLLNSDGTLQTSCAKAFPTIVNKFLCSDFLQNVFPRSRLWGMEALARKANHPVPVDMVSGACLMMKREAFEKVGRFSIDYFVFSEDVDLCYKAWKAGYDVLYLDEAVVLHHGGGSTSKKGQSRFSDVLMQESTYIFMKKYYGFPYHFLFRATTLTNSLCRLLILKIAQIAGTDVCDDPSGSVEKWRGILNWSLGREKWAEELSLAVDMTPARWKYVRDMMADKR